MIRKIIICLAIIYSAQFLSGCDECECPGATDIEVAYKDFSISAVNTEEGKNIEQDSALNRDAFGLIISLEEQELILMAESMGSWGFSQAKACDCTGFRYRYEQDIVDIDIQALNANGKLEDVTRFFALRYYADELITVNEYLQLTQRQSSESRRNSQILLLYTGKEAFPSGERLHVRIELSSGKIMEQESSVITFVN